jgi:hypothetical protein
MLVCVALPGLCQTPAAVTTYHNDTSRTGLNNSETTLTWSNVTANSFGLLFSYNVDGQVYAQPLYVPGLTINGAIHNVVFVATENNSVYAFDADDNGADGGLLWQANFNIGPPGVKVTPMPSDDLQCYDITPMNGITGTPVIDLASKTLYVVVKTKEVLQTGTKYVHRLHALDLLNGQEKFGGPATFQGTVAGSCGNSDGNGNIVFSAYQSNQRAGLALVNGTIYTAFASHCDINPYNGWLMAHSASTLQQTALLNTSPDGTIGDCRSGIWQSGAAPAADSSSNLFVATGNGTFNASRGGKSYGDSMLKLAGDGLTVGDYFTPATQAQLDGADLDLGAGGALLLPDQPGSNPHLLVVAGKTGTIFVLNRDNLGKGGLTGAVQQIPNAVGSQTSPFPMPAYVNQAIYFGGSSDTIKGFKLTSSGKLNPIPFAQGGTHFGDTGAGVSASSDPEGNNAIVWTLDGGNNPAVLHAYKATDLSELYNSNQAPSRDNPGPGTKFSVPTVSGGKVFVGTAGALAVYGNF